jgi:NADP-dependent 3-hydroxy acid dehydrogenase YdfG
VIAIFGAGSGLGASVARRFAREGFQGALVARRKDRLDALVEQLTVEGVDASVSPPISPRQTRYPVSWARSEAVSAI